LFSKETLTIKIEEELHLQYKYNFSYRSIPFLCKYPAETTQETIEITMVEREKQIKKRQLWHKDN